MAYIKQGVLQQQANTIEIDVDAILATAVIHLNETSIVGSPLTSWDNLAGDSQYDFDVVTGTLTIGTQNSLSMVEGDNSSYVRTTGETTAISTPHVIFLVTKQNAGATDGLIDARSNAAKRSHIWTFAGDWIVHSGSSFNTGVATDTSWHVIAAKVKTGTNETIFALDDSTPVTGTMTITDYIAGTLFANYTQAAQYNGDIAEYVLIEDDLSAAEMLAVNAQLMTKWGI